MKERLLILMVFMRILKDRNFKNGKDKIIFLGTAGGRFSVFYQIRKSGGIWFHLGGKTFVIDPGPGALVTALKNKINMSKVDGIFLSHRHLDHCADINSIMESMVISGKRTRYLFAPSAALDEDPVVLHYNRDKFNILYLKEYTDYAIGDLKISTKLTHLHTTPTFGAVFKSDSYSFAYIADTLYTDQLAIDYRADVVIVNTVFKNQMPGYMHLSASDMYKFLEIFKPKILILTHFGMGFLNESPHLVAKEISQKTNTNVIAAWDNMIVELENI